MVKMPCFETYCSETGIKILVTETGQQLPPSLVCFISNCRTVWLKQPVDVFQILMVVACWLLIFRKKFLMVVAYFWIRARANLTIHWELQDLSTISPSISPQAALIIESVKKFKNKNCMQFDLSIPKFTKNA